MKVQINFCEDQHFKAQARNFTNIEMDEPKTFHGSNLGPSPVEYLLIGIGGCLGSTLSFCFRKNDIEIEDLRLTVDGILKHTGPQNYLRLKKIICEVECKAKGSEELKQKCFKKFKEYCIVSNSLGIPIEISIL
ncbi:MAG: OsmC family peroxiredoxin [Promethearchaeota archaeon]|nr:MAG: OsmC family peroxiredoxin [Candidatus Lokiarchaeota archaeon]